MRSSSGVSQYRDAAIRAVNQATKKLANSSFEAELARLDYEYKLKQVKLQESYLAAKAHANISIVSSSVTLPSTSPVVFPTRSRQFYIPRLQLPLRLSLRYLTLCLHHIRHLVSLFYHLILHNRVILYMVTHRCTIHPVLQHFQAFPSNSWSQDSFYPSQCFSTVYPNVPMSQGYSNSQFPFSQPLSDSVDIPPHLTTSCLPNPVHVDTSVPHPSFPPTHNLDFRVPMLHKMTNPTNPHCKLSELVPSNTSINVSSSSSSGSTIEPHDVSQVPNSDSQIPASTCLESCTLETPSPPQLSSVVIHGDKDMTEVASESYFIQDEIVSTSDSSVQESSSVQQTRSVQESSDHHLENVIPVKLCDKPELSLNDDASSLCLFDPHGSLVLDLSVSKDYKHQEDELFDIGHCYLVTQLFYHIQLHKLCSFQQFYVTERCANYFRYYWFPDKSSRGIDLKSVKGDIIQFTSSLFSHSIDVVIFICTRLT